jgi:SAM-dependent methyltransferase
MYSKIQARAYSLHSKTLLEIGTGRRINVPLALWLMGAERVLTMDINPYLKEELIKEDISFIHQNQQAIREVFSSRILEDRLSALLNLTSQEWCLSDLLDLAKIVYLSPADARNIPLASGTVDYCVSYNVLEHIELDVLRNILIEVNRVTSENAIFVHCIDYSDHFSHSDASISSINFLKYSDERWNRIAGNRYMYANRLRHDDFIQLFRRANRKVIDVETKKDTSALGMMRAGKLVVSERFEEKPEDVLAITSAWIVSEKAN